MSIKTIQIIKCDICGAETTTDAEKKFLRVKYPVIFTTNQTDGIACKPYISEQDIHICGECQPKVLKIVGQGAQGYNEYRINTDEEAYK